MRDSTNAILNYTRVNPSSGSYITAGLQDAERRKQQKFENRMAEAVEGRNQEKWEVEKRQQLADRAAQAAAWADDPEKWKQAQEIGAIPPSLDFEQRGAFVYGYMKMEQQRKRAADKESTRQADRGYELDVRRQKEVERSNRAREANFRDRTAQTGAGGGAGGGPGGGLKSGDESYIARQVSALFDGTYDVRTGAIQIKDDANRRLAQKMIADASRLLANNPNMTRSQAVSQAAERNGINIGSFAVNMADQGGGAAAPPQIADPLGLRQ